MTETRPAVQADLPDSLWRDRSFWGMTATQFLGAFNDNLFKQVVLLLCFAYKQRHGTEDYQPYAQALFALPFVLFSGFAGFLADRNSKRAIVVICKVAEIVIMLLGTAAVAGGNLWTVLVVLTLMGTHSAFFGPSKYGILPELIRERDLSQANGIFQMTSFLAIILGTAAGGYLMEYLAAGGELVRLTFPAIAVLGTGTALLVRKTPVAKPELAFRAAEMLIDRPTARMILTDRPMLWVLLVYSVFWLVGGIVMLNVTAFAKGQLGVSEGETSVTTACLALGIAIGCGAAAAISGKRIRFGLVTAGSWGMIVALGLLSAIGAVDGSVKLKLWSVRATLVGAGGFAGLYTIPLQAFLQSRPGADEKGRVMGAMNLITWIAILLSAAVYSGIDRSCTALDQPISWGFAATGCLMLPVALFFCPRETERPAA